MQLAEEKPEGAPEWMVSYADMITIMMSFFVIMFAIATGEVEKGKKNRHQEAAIQSLNHRFGPKYQPFASWGLMPGNSPIKGGGSRMKVKPGEAEPEEGATVRVLHKEKARIRVPGQGDRIVIGGVVYYDGSGTDIAAAQLDRLRTIAEELAGKPQEVEILGHVSSLPLPEGSKHRDRWDLAYARCRQVSQALQGMKIDPERIRIGVVHSNHFSPAGSAAATGSAAAAGEDARVDIFLTDALPEKFRGK
jgi:chemotaxis protein MotB